MPAGDPSGDKSDGAFKTIGEVAAMLGVPQHILRYWETRFPELKPLQRAGNRRYYRPADVALAQRIDRLLNREGYTVRGVQQLLAGTGGGGPQPAPAVVPHAADTSAGDLTGRLIALRDGLKAALADAG